PAQPKGVDTATSLSTGAQDLFLTSFTKGPPAVANVTLYHPFSYSDCDPDSVGTARNSGSCDPVADAGGVLQSSGRLFWTTGDCTNGVSPAVNVCNGGTKAGQPCGTALSDCGSFTARVPRWKPAATLDPLTLPAAAA